MYMFMDSALGVKTELVCGTGVACSGEGKRKSLLEGFYYGHDSDIALTMIPLQSGRLSLLCVFSCKNETKIK